MTTRTIETPKDASISAPSWSPTGTQLAYVANFDDGTVSVVSTATNAVSATIPVGNGPITVAICPA